MLKTEPWRLIETGRPDVSDVSKHETLFFVGNGLIGVRGTLEENDGWGHPTLPADNTTPTQLLATPANGGQGGDMTPSCGTPALGSLGVEDPHNSSFQAEKGASHVTPAKSPKSATLSSKPQRATYMNGIYEERSVTYPHKEFSYGSCQFETFMIPVPDATILSVHVGGEEFGFHSTLSGESKVLSHTRVLDFKTAGLFRKCVWESKSGKQLEVTTSRVALMKHTSAVAMRVCVRPLNFSTSREIRVVTSLAHTTDDTRVKEVNGADHDNYAESLLHAQTRRSHIDILCKTRQMCTIVKSSAAAGANAAGASGQNAPGGKSFESDFVAVLPTSVNSSGPAGLGTTPNTTNVPLGKSPNSAGGIPKILQQPPLSAPILTSPNPNQTGSFRDPFAGNTPGGSVNDMLPPLAQSAPQQQGSPGKPNQTVKSSTSVLQEENVVLTSFSAMLEKGEEMVLDKVAVFVTSRDDVVEELSELATNVLDDVFRRSYPTLLEEQAQFVDKFWSEADVQIMTEDDASIQGTLRFNLIQLLMSAGRTPGTNFGVRGLTSANLGGHYAWDTEIFIFPFFVYTHLPVAKSMVQFRIDTLPQAMDRALDFELSRGALYPWRTINGNDSTVSSVACTMQLHINADIAYALQQYYEVSNDTQLLRDGGAAVLLNTALVWIEWGIWERGMFHLRYVTGPDEYNVLVHDNCYTNLMAQNHLLFAAKIARFFMENYCEDWNRLASTYNIELTDIEKMENAADKIVIPFDAHKKIHLQDENFLRKKQWTYSTQRGRAGSLAGAGGPRSVRSSGMHTHKRDGMALMEEFHPLTIYRHQVCKQADVILSQVLLTHKFTDDEKQANFDFYEAITTDDSSLTSSTLGIMAAELGLSEKAYMYFEKSLKVDTDNIVGNTGAGIHAASMAGSWSCVVQGFAGLRNINGVLHFNPWLPDGWQEYRFTVRHSGVLIKVVVGRRMVEYSAEESARIRIVHGSTRVHLAKGKSVSVKLVKDIRSFDFDAVVFDIQAIINNIQQDHYDAWTSVLQPLFENASQKDGESFRGNTELSKEQYLAYIRHHPYISGKKYTGLQKLLLEKGISVPVGDPNTATEDEFTIHGLILRKLKAFREIVHNRGRMGIVQGAETLIRDLRNNGIAVGCVSSSHNGQWMLRQSSIFNLIDYFLDSKTGDEMGLDFKPEANYFGHCASKLQSTPERTILILESVAGFSKQALQQFGLVLSMDVANDNNTLADFKTAGADALLSDLNVLTDDLDAYFEHASRLHQSTGMSYSISPMKAKNTSSEGMVAPRGSQEHMQMQGSVNQKSGPPTQVGI